MEAGQTGEGNVWLLCDSQVELPHLVVRSSHWRSVIQGCHSCLRDINRDPRGLLSDEIVSDLTCIVPSKIQRGHPHPGFVRIVVPGILRKAHSALRTQQPFANLERLVAEGTLLPGFFLSLTYSARK